MYKNILDNLIGLKEASEVTRGLNPHNSLCVQISLDFETGEIYTNTHVSENSWTEYRDNNVETVCFTNRGMSEQKILEKINETAFMREQVIKAGLME